MLFDPALVFSTPPPLTLPRDGTDSSCYWRRVGGPRRRASPKVLLSVANGMPATKSTKYTNTLWRVFVMSWRSVLHVLAESCRSMEIDKLYHGECNKWIRTSVLQGIAAGCTEELLHGGLGISGCWGIYCGSWVKENKCTASSCGKNLDWLATSHDRLDAPSLRLRMQRSKTSKPSKPNQMYHKWIFKWSKRAVLNLWYLMILSVPSSHLKPMPRCQDLLTSLWEVCRPSV